MKMNVLVTAALCLLVALVEGSYPMAQDDGSYNANMYETPYQHDSHLDDTPAYSNPATTYSAPAPVYSAPAYMAPATGYGQDDGSYNANMYETPYQHDSRLDNAPAYSAPAPVYSAPAPVYSAPAPTYSAPAYMAPATGYGQDDGSYNANMYETPYQHDSRLDNAPAYSEPAHSAPAYSAPAYSAPAATSDDGQYRPQSYMDGSY